MTAVFALCVSGAMAEGTPTATPTPTPTPTNTIDPYAYVSPTPEPERTYFAEMQNAETGEAIVHEKIEATSNTIRFDHDLLWFDLVHQGIGIAGPVDHHARLRVAGLPGSRHYMKAGLLALGDNDNPTSCFAVLAHSLMGYGVYGYGDDVGIVGRSGAGYGGYIYNDLYVEDDVFCDSVANHSWAYDGNTSAAIAALASVRARTGTNDLDHSALDGLIKVKAIVPLRAVGGYSDFAAKLGNDDSIVGPIEKAIDPVTRETITGGNVEREGVNLSKLVMLMAPVIVEQDAKIKSLEARVAALEKGGTRGNDN